MGKVTQQQRDVKRAAKLVDKAVFALCDAATALGDAGCTRAQRAMNNAAYEAATAIGQAESDVSSALEKEDPS